jgi:hypothetical protein
VLASNCDKIKSAHCPCSGVHRTVICDLLRSRVVITARYGMEILSHTADTDCLAPPDMIHAPPRHPSPVTGGNWQLQQTPALHAPSTGGSM